MGERFNLMDMDLSVPSDLITICRCGSGWLALIVACFIKIQEHCRENGIEELYINDIKEKFGHLSIYLSSYDDEIEEIIEEYSKIASVTCEKCGDEGKLRTDLPWIQTLCGQHYREARRK